MELRSAPPPDCAEATASLKQPGDTIKVKERSDHGGEALGGGEERTRGGQSRVGARIPVGGGEDRGGTRAGGGEGSKPCEVHWELSLQLWSWAGHGGGGEGRRGREGLGSCPSQILPLGRD